MTQSVRTSLKLPSRTNATNVRSKIISNHWKSVSAVSFCSSVLLYDYLLNDCEYLGAGIRFMRSLKIAVSMSLDYNVGLYGLSENSEEYNKVRNKRNHSKSLIF